MVRVCICVIVRVYAHVRVRECAHTWNSACVACQMVEALKGKPDDEEMKKKLNKVVSIYFVRGWLDALGYLHVGCTHTRTCTLCFSSHKFIFH